MTKYYKYRDFSAMDRVADIFVNQRLYCANKDQLNDPLEGLFGANVLDENLHVTVKVSDGLRVCSLSATLDNVLQWTHYADGHKGIAIEFEPDEPLEKIHYSEQLFSAPDTQSTPREALLHKSIDWKYENEYRFITHDKWLTGKVIGVVFGIRVPDATKILVSNYCSDLGAYTANTFLDSKNYKVKVNYGA